MSWLQIFLAWLANCAGQRQGVAQDAARQEWVRGVAENQALRTRVAIDERVQQQQPDEVRAELLRDWSRDEGKP